MSNFGKSTLLRQMQTPEAAARYRELTGKKALFVYVDCNRMLEMSPRGFFEVTLRAALEVLPGSESHLKPVVEEQYRMVVQPPNDFAVPLAFNDALVALVEKNTRQVILLLDEFDEVLTDLDPRILLNLRALRDRYGPDLSYVIASAMPPSEMLQRNELVAEFAELFEASEHYLGPLSLDETRRMAAEIFEAAGYALNDAEADFIVQEAGGHPGLIQAVGQVLLQVESGAPALYQQQAFDLANAMLESDRIALAELNRLWQQLTAEEQQAVVDAVVAGRFDPSIDRILRQRGLISAAPDDRESPQFLGQLFTRYVRRKALTRPGSRRGIQIDTDSGEVWVDGLAVETLTDLEYRLLLLLYGRLDKLCDKYQLVEAVWGEHYIDEVDDARIEKLVSRLRTKLEAGAASARYLVTVRGRGYRLSSVPEQIA